MMKSWGEYLFGRKEDNPNPFIDPKAPSKAAVDRDKRRKELYQETMYSPLYDSQKESILANIELSNPDFDADIAQRRAKLKTLVDGLNNQNIANQQALTQKFEAPGRTATIRTSRAILG